MCPAKAKTRLQTMNINEILADVQTEGADPFKDVVKETPTDSPTETKPEEVKEEVTPEEGKSTPEETTPFHKHPRWIERENELKQLREREELTTRELAELKAFKEELSQKNEVRTTNIPEWFKELYGENEVAWQKYYEHEKQKEAEIEQRFIAKQEAQKRQVEEETKRWDKWVGDEISKLASDATLNFDPKERNELMATMLKYKPTDDAGNLDFKAGFDIYRALKKPDTAHSNARKQLADETTKTGGGERKTKDYMTPAELRNKSWHSL